MTYEIKRTEDSVEYIFNGVLDENALLDELVTDDKNIIFNFKFLDRCNSFGMIKWIKFLENFDGYVKFTYKKLPPVIIDYLNFASGFLPKGAVVESALLPYHCEACANTTFLDFDLTVYIDASEALDKVVHACERIENERACSHCGEMAQLDINPRHSFAFLNRD